MRLKQRIWLLLVALMAVVLTVDLAVSYRKLSGELRTEVEYDARTVYGFMMATRRIYQQQFIDSGVPLNDKTVGFLPAHSFSRISKDYASWNDNGIIFNNVSDVPRNPRNQADRFELEAMAAFRADQKLLERMTNIVDDKGVGYLLYTAPIWVESSCLKCHGDRDAAPPSIRGAYAEAYGYKLGDLRGVVSIKMPTEKFDARLLRLWSSQLIKSLIGYAVIFMALGFILERLVMRRLSRLQAGAKQIAAGAYGTRVAEEGDDEVTQLADAFNGMAGEVQTRDSMLGKLSQAVEQSPESIVITDTEGRIEYVNASFLANTGYLREEVLGANPRVLKSNKTAPEVYPSLWAALTKGEVWHGEFVNQRKDGSEYSESAIISPVRDVDGRVTHYLAVKQDLTDKKLAEAEIRRLAFFDGLTGLPNRSLLMDRLTQALVAGRRSNRQEALLLINIDRFKNINDAGGHQLGDKLLRVLAERLVGVLRDGDTLARLAADEFALLLPDMNRLAEHAGRDALSVSEKIQTELQRPLVIDGDDVIVTVSIGVTVFPEVANETPDDILRRADNALHRAKQAGGNQVAFFESGMGDLAEQRYRLERELRRAIPAGELRLFLQPQVDASQRLVGAEALVRWQHPERGLIPPGVFIPIAEESDLIVELGAWVLTEALRLMAQEDRAGYPLRLSVNLSPRQFRKPAFVPWVKSVLAASGAQPGYLTLEVTEGLVIDNLDEVVAKMRELTALGIHFSVDDFGTGYSSLAYIKRLPIHELKIDKTFVQDAPTDADDAALVETILAVAGHLRLKVVAEGVETEAQAAFLNARASVIHQGYLYGRPEAAEVWIERWRKERLS